MKWYSAEIVLKTHFQELSDDFSISMYISNENLF